MNKVLIYIFLACCGYANGEIVCVKNRLQTSFSKCLQIGENRAAKQLLGARYEYIYYVGGQTPVL